MHGWVRWADALYAASLRLRPYETVDHRLVLGEGIGGIALGMPRAMLDARWGAPEVPAWGRSRQREIATYPRVPFAIEFDRASGTVAEITLYAGRHRATTADGIAPMFMYASEAMAWLDACGVPATRERSTIAAPSVALHLTLDRAGFDPRTEPWVRAIAIGVPAPYEPDDDDSPED